MKIAYLSDSTVPSLAANSVHVMKMCSAFAANGHDVALLCYRDRQAGDPFSTYGVRNDFRLVDIPTSGIPGVRRLLRAAFARSYLARNRDVELVYGRDLFSLYASGHGAPLAFEAHVPPTGPLERRLVASLVRRKSFMRLVVISNALRDEFLRVVPGLDPHRVVVAHDAADPAQHASPGTALPALGRPGALQVGYVGSLLPGKGAELLIDLAARMPDIDFHIVGGSPEEVEKLRRRLPGDNLHLHGHVRHSLVPGFLERFDVALFPMQKTVLRKDGVDIARWTSPMKLFEYMSVGKVIVGSDLPVIREVLEQEANALLVEPEDIDGWCAAIRRLAGDPGLRNALATEAKARFLKFHTWSARASEVIDPSPDYKVG